MNKQIIYTLILSISISSLSFAVILQNSSFEEDFENDGVPDKWNIPKSTKVKLVGKATDGNKAALFFNGYILASQNLDIKKPANQNIKLAVDAAGFDGARLGILIGYMHQRSDGSKKWINHRLLWNRKLGKEYKTIRLNHQISKEAIGTRLWIAFYRTNGKGSILLDNVRVVVGKLSVENQKIVNRLIRELNYLNQRYIAAEKHIGRNENISQAIKQIAKLQKECFLADNKSLQSLRSYIEKQLPILSATLNKLLYPEKALVACFSDPYVRLNPAKAVAENPKTNFEITSLQGEYQAVGLVLINCTKKMIKSKINITGIDTEKFDVKLRKQVFLETWYKKEKQRIADPLPLLDRESDKWCANITGGQRVKLYIGFHIPKDISGTIKTNISIQANDKSINNISLPLTLKISPVLLPETPAFHHLAFIYTTGNVASHSSELCAKDLTQHYVDMMEFPYLPKVTFTPKGEINSVDFSKHDRFMQIFGSKIKLMIFGEGGYKNFKCNNESNLEFLSKQWKLAYSNLLRAWLDHANKEGFDISHFSILPDDEPHSANYKNAPDTNIANAIELYKLTRNTAPKLPIMLTLSDYAFPADVKALIPYVDIVLPLWPYRTKLPRNAPASYNPRDTYRRTIYPMLDAQRKKSGMQIWSYHIAAGKSDDVLISNRTYPILAVAEGLTGVATWAYNVSRGSTWDDTDGGLLDYIFVYDGTENCVTNKKCNPTGEVIVPSIRWQALRAGIQDAKILLYLKAVLSKEDINSQLKPAIQTVLSESIQIDKNKFELNAERIANFAGKIRKIYAQLVEKN